MKRFAMAVALAGLMSVTALAGEIPTNGVMTTTPPPTSASTNSSVTLANALLTIITLIGR